MAKIDDFMRALSVEIGLDTPLKPDFPGVYMFSIGEATVSITDKAGEISLMASFGPIPEKKEAFYTDMLTADLFYQGTLGSVAGLKSADNKVIVKKVLGPDLDGQKFSEEVEDFLNSVENWKERMLEFR